MAVRNSAGIFDVSHMGEIELRGKDALALVQKVTTNNAARLAINQAHYSALVYPEGTFVDDILVYRFADDHFFLCVNASNADKDFDYIKNHARGNVSVENLPINMRRLLYRVRKLFRLFKRQQHSI